MTFEQVRRGLRRIRASGLHRGTALSIITTFPCELHSSYRTFPTPGPSSTSHSSACSFRKVCWLTCSLAARSSSMPVIGLMLTTQFQCDLIWICLIHAQLLPFALLPTCRLRAVSPSRDACVCVSVSVSVSMSVCVWVGVCVCVCV